MSKSGGVFQIDDVTRTMSKGGGVRLVFHPSKFRPPPPTWLAGYGPAYIVGDHPFCFEEVGRAGDDFFFYYTWDVSEFSLCCNAINKFKYKPRSIDTP